MGAYEIVGDVITTEEQRGNLLKMPDHWFENRRTRL